MSTSAIPPALNVFGQPLVPCSFDPLTGFLRDGCCKTNEQDVGTHIICVIVTASFLMYSKSRGNDLMTPRLEWNFPGLQPGDQWCLCANRWLEAMDDGVAPLVVLESTNIKMLQLVELEILEQFDSRTGHDELSSNL
ncbi:DUF2237 domain-containing protein [Undibacterium sp. Jales W-56]|uniref:DUF2237 family protein n=1 Tax=Undibacterium sp. Jales W-56 TaxID=2897325 RepID=UPI0021D2436B|nr:DUF2237 domain-containing protein [Undibacterium sp. Jales W-56]MCU6432743.1 DUF2237 domain-containing protein [Undibacterium sp. Jales W-56]